MVFSPQGTMQDGQHRCHAVVLAGVPIEVCAFGNVPDAVRQYLDQGCKRTVADAVQIGGGQCAQGLAAAARFTHLLATGANYMLTVDETIDEFARCPRGFQWAEKAPRKAGVTVAPYWGALVWLYDSHADFVELFHEEMVTGQNLAAGSPTLLLREALLRIPRGTARDASVCMRVLNAFRAYVADQPLSRLSTSSAGWKHFEAQKEPQRAAQEASAGNGQSRQLALSVSEPTPAGQPSNGRDDHAKATEEFVQS
jgi:hypothetical protein